MENYVDPIMINFERRLVYESNADESNGDESNADREPPVDEILNDLIIRSTVFADGIDPVIARRSLARARSLRRKISR